MGRMFESLTPKTDSPIWYWTSGADTNGRCRSWRVHTNHVNQGPGTGEEVESESKLTTPRRTAPARKARKP